MKKILTLLFTILEYFLFIMLLAVSYHIMLYLLGIITPLIYLFTAKEHSIPDVRKMKKKSKNYLIDADKTTQIKDEWKIL